LRFEARVAFNRRERALRSVVVEETGLEQFDRAQNRVERRSQLVRDGAGDLKVRAAAPLVTTVLTITPSADRYRKLRAATFYENVVT
jgi:hypothetical protein